MRGVELVAWRLRTSYYARRHLERGEAMQLIDSGRLEESDDPACEGWADDHALRSVLEEKAPDVGGLPFKPPGLRRYRAARDTDPNIHTIVGATPTKPRAPARWADVVPDARDDFGGE